MNEIEYVLFLFGVGIIALGLLVVGFAVWNRRRNKRKEAGDLPASSSAAPAEVVAPRQPGPEPIRLYLQADGSASVELDGRRYARLSEIGDDRLTQQALAAVGAMQRFAGLAPLAPRSELKDELRVGHLDEGLLVVEFHGQRYRKLIEIRDGDIGRQLLTLIGELNAFARGVTVHAPAPAAKPSEPANPAEKVFLKHLESQAAAPAPLKMPGLIDSLRRPAPKVGPMPVGIAAQIEAILQEQLESNAALSGRSVHVVTARDGGLAVDVDGQVFTLPDGVKDPAVREAVQKAIQTWEKE